MVQNCCKLSLFISSFSKGNCAYLICKDFFLGLWYVFISSFQSVSASMTCFFFYTICTGKTTRVLSLVLTECRQVNSLLRIHVVVYVKTWGWNLCSDADSLFVYSALLAMVISMTIWRWWCFEDWILSGTMWGSFLSSFLLLNLQFYIHSLDFALNLYIAQNILNKISTGWWQKERICINHFK